MKEKSHFELTRARHSRAAHTLNARRPIDRRASGWVRNDMSDDLSEHHHLSFTPWILSIWPQIFFTFKFFSHIRPTTQRSVIHYRSFKTIDIDNFKSDILSSPLCTNPASDSSDVSEQLSSTLNSILDIHAPLKSKIFVLRPHTPWINPEILVAKRERSRLERSWRRWKSLFDRKKFRAQCNFVRSLISKAKSNFLTNLITESSSNPRTLWKTLNSILHRKPSNSSPDTPDTQSLANLFLQFFSDKIERIRSKFSPSDSLILFFFQLSLLQIYLISIQPLSQKFVISFSLLKTNNVNSTQFLLSFWNSVLTNLALLSLLS